MLLQRGEQPRSSAPLRVIPKAIERRLTWHAACLAQAAQMKTMRNGQVWFTTLEEALEAAQLEPASDLTAPSKLGMALVGLHAGVFVVAGWAVLQQLLRHR